MDIDAEAFASIEASDNGSTVLLSFAPKGGGEPVTVKMPTRLMSLGIPEMQRLAAVEQQRRVANTPGLREATHTSVKTIDAHTDVAALRVYLHFDKGLPNEIVYSAHMATAARFGLELMTKLETWLAENSPQTEGGSGRGRGN